MGTGSLTQGLEIRKLSRSYGLLLRRRTNSDFDGHHTDKPIEELRHSESYLETQKQLTDDTNEIPNVDIANLTDNQRRLFLRVVEHYRLIQAGENPPPLQINIDGTARTGKLYLIDAISKALTEMANERGTKSPILRLAPTGVAAFNIKGRTIHSSLYLPTRGDDELDAARRLQLQERLQPIKYIILDEKSMVGRRFLSRKDSRLREGFLKHNELLGNCSILMFGDFGQLPPVGDTALFYLNLREGNSPAVLKVNHGREVYLSLSENLTLNRLMRQRGDDDDIRRLRQVLEHLTNDTITDEDCDVLNSRTLQNLPPEQRAGFDDALYVCATKALVDNVNLHRLAISNKPVLTLPTVHKGLELRKRAKVQQKGRRVSFYL
jgi:ATP-dependent DNA helicase PIF1